MILVICSLYSFLSNTALLGPAVYITIFAETLQVSPVAASQLISYPTLVYGIGTLVTVPMYLKFGRRPILLGSIVIYLSSLIGCSQCTSFGALMACRIIQALSSGICEAIPVQLVNDIFFRKSMKLVSHETMLSFSKYMNAAQS
jgi:predicted MFS family arabinose efflux permease